MSSEIEARHNSNLQAKNSPISNEQGSGMITDLIFLAPFQLTF